jgi:hypothetical protein
MRVVTEKNRLTLSDASSSSWLLAGLIVLTGLFFTFNGLAVYLGFIVGHIDSANVMLLLGTALLALGLWLVHTSPNLMTVFEPARSRVLISKKRLFFSSPPQEIHFQELSRLEIASDQEVSEPGASHQYSLRLVTVEGKRFPLCNHSHKKQREFEEALSKTRSFLRGYGLMI